MTAKSKRVLSSILAVLMLTSTMMVGVGFGATKEEQVAGYYNLDSSNQLSGSPSDKSEVVTSSSVPASPLNGAAKVYKDIKARSENEFEVTLTVKTLQDVENFEASPNAAVIFVMDLSNSMSDTTSGGKPTSQDPSRLSLAKEEAKKFIEDFATTTSESGGVAPDAIRKLAIVGFGVNAYTFMHWTDVSGEDNAANLTAAKNTIDGIDRKSVV